VLAALYAGTMNRILSIVLLFHFSLSAHGLSIGCDTARGLQSIDQLDVAYERAKIVFLANVEIEYSTDSTAINWKYKVIKPALKGNLPAAGILNPGGRYCDHPDVTEKGIFLVFWSKEGELITSDNSKMVMYGDSKVIEKWIVKWAHEKAYNK
jgi:hypothetical protein